MKTIVSKLAQAAAITNSNDEIARLVQLAKDSITPYNVAAKMVYGMLNTVPTIDGTYEVEASEQAQRNEGAGQRVMQDVRWYDAFMVIGVNVAATHGYLEFNDFVNIFTQWNKDSENCPVQLSEETIKENVKAATVALVRDNWIESQGKEAEIAIPDPQNPSKQIKVKRFIRKTTSKFNELYEAEYAELKERVTMKCEPLRFAPEPWYFDADGAVKGIHADANLKFCKGKSVPSQKTLDAVNKVMLKPLHAHPAMIKLARLAVSNTQVFREIDDHDDASWEAQVRVWDAMRRLVPETDYFFPITLDHRGRQYYRGGVITPQGGNACKACFIDGEMPELGKSGMHALYVGLATALGIKGSVKSRMYWTQQQLHNGTINKWMQEHPANFLRKFKNEDKYQAYVIMHEIINAYEWASKEGKSITQYRCGVIIHQDGICNGMQHMGVITRNRQTCTATNVIPMTHSDSLNDAYGLVVSNTMFLQKYGRDIGKTGTMVAGYGASDRTIMKSVRDKLGFEEYDESLGKDLVQAIHTTLPAIESVTAAIKLACEDILTSGETEIVMWAKDGFKQVQQYKYNTAAALPLGSFATVKYTEEADVLNCEQMITATSPNMIHMNDGCHVRAVALESDWNVVTVHDSYGCAPAHYFKTNVILAETLADNYTDYCPVANLYQDYKLDWQGFIMSSDAITLDEVRQAYNAFS